MLFFWRQFIPWLPKFLPYTVCYLIIVRCGQGGSKTTKDWQEMKLFVVIDWVKSVSEETNDFISPVL